MKRMVSATLLAALVAVVCALPAYADVTIKATSSGPMGSMPTTVWIKGAKMRQDITVQGRAMTTIIDAAAKRMIFLDPDTRQAMVYDLDSLAAQVQKVTGPGEASVSMKLTGETRVILGRECTGYVVSVTMPVNMPGNVPGNARGNKTMVTLGGPVWIAKDSPGTADWVRFYKLAGENGLFFSAPGGAAAQEARSQALMYKALADAGGIPYEQQISVTIPGAPMQPAAVTVTVNQVSTDPIPDERFEVPEGYRKVPGRGPGVQ